MKFARFRQAKVHFIIENFENTTKPIWNFEKMMQSSNCASGLKMPLMLARSTFAGCPKVMRKVIAVTDAGPVRPLHRGVIGSVGPLRGQERADELESTTKGNH